MKPLLDELGIRILSCISGDGKYREVASSHRATRVDDGLLQGDDQCRAQDGGALRHSVLRRLVLRHRGFQRFAARNRAAADRARRAGRIDGAHRSGDRARRGEGLGRDRTLQAALQGQEGPADHRRRQVVVGRCGLAGSRSRTGRHQRQEIDQGGQGAHQGADGPGRPHDRGYDAARNVQDAQGRQGRHHAVGRQVAIRRAQGGDALARHQPGTQPRLYGLCRHGEAGRGNRQGAVQSGVGAAAPAGAVGECRRRAGRPRRWRRWMPKPPNWRPIRWPRRKPAAPGQSAFARGSISARSRTPSAHVA